MTTKHTVWRVILGVCYQLKVCRGRWFYTRYFVFLSRTNVILIKINVLCIKRLTEFETSHVAYPGFSLCMLFSFMFVCLTGNYDLSLSVISASALYKLSSIHCFRLTIMLQAHVRQDFIRWLMVQINVTGSKQLYEYSILYSRDIYSNIPRTDIILTFMPLLPQVLKWRHQQYPGVSYGRHVISQLFQQFSQKMVCIANIIELKYVHVVIIIFARYFPNECIFKCISRDSPLPRLRK